MQYQSPFAGHLQPSKLHRNHKLSSASLRHEISPYEQHSRQVDFHPQHDNEGYKPQGIPDKVKHVVHKTFVHTEHVPHHVVPKAPVHKANHLIQANLEHMHVTKGADLHQSSPFKYLDSEEPFMAHQRVGQHTEIIPQIDFQKIIEHNRSLYLPSQRMQNDLTTSELARTYAGPTNRQFGAINSRDFHQVNHRTFIDQLSFGRSSSAAGISTTPRVSIHVGAIRSN
jgi:hypothetical protein